MSNNTVMVCKLVLHDITTTRYANQDLSKATGQVRFGAVYEGSQEKQEKSENAIFGSLTPYAEFKAAIHNQAVLDALVPGKKYYVHFTEAPD